MRKSQEIQNTTEKPLWVQIEYWADLLYLLPNERITIVIYVEVSGNDDFEIEGIGNTGEDLQIVYLPNSTEYFFLEGDKEIHHTKYGSNVVGWSNNLCQESSLKGSILHPSQSKI